MTFTGNSPSNPGIPPQMADTDGLSEACLATHLLCLRHALMPSNLDRNDS